MSPGVEIIPLAALAIPIIVAPIAILAKHNQRKRELEHAERMRALELGQPLYPHAHLWPALAATAIGAGTPVGVFLVTWLASLTTGVDDGVWAGAGLVGIAGVIGGTTLGYKMIAAATTTTKTPPVDPYANGKPQYDPDAYDVVGRRG